MVSVNDRGKKESALFEKLIMWVKKKKKKKRVWESELILLLPAA